MNDETYRNKQRVISKTVVTDFDAENTWTDEFGVIYSADKKRLLKAPKDISEYSIPDGTIIVCDWAFGECDMLRSIEFCKSLIAIGCHAFHECLSLKTIIIRGNISEISCGAFFGCDSLQTVTISEGLLTIGPEAFGTCSSLISIVLPNSLTTIGEWAFGGCVSLKTFIIPISVRSIEQGAFEGCNCEIISKSEFYKSDGYDLFSVKDKKLIYCSTHIARYNIPDSINIIGEYAFFDCTMLKSIVIPDSVIRIEKGSFCGCESLFNVKLSNSLIHIGENAFSGCNSIGSIVIPDSVTEVGKEAFEGCDSLKVIFVSIGSKARFKELLPNFKGKIIETENKCVNNSDNDDNEESLSFKGNRFGFNRRNYL